MFESNFPVDRASYAYTNGWNSFKRVTRNFSATEKAAMFQGAAARAYRL
jgi:predicted TIM-barrel fold metal-dependent hydrolase